MFEENSVSKNDILNSHCLQLYQTRLLLLWPIVIVVVSLVFYGTPRLGFEFWRALKSRSFDNKIGVKTDLNL